MEANNKLREALQLAKATFETLIKFQGDGGFVKTWAELGRDAMLAALAAPATAEKSSAVGDAAKLREALDECRRIASGLGGCRLNDYWKLNEIVRVCDAALAAPPRNCDRPECATSKAAQEVWRREDGGKTAYYEWLLATTTEGVNDENK